jgi:hypothetical protein
MSETITIEQFNGTRFVEGVFSLFKGKADNEFALQWKIDPSLMNTSNLKFDELPQTAFGNIEVQTSVNNETLYSDVPSSTKELSFYDSLQQKIFYKLVFPSHWTAEGVNKPNITAKSNAFKICWELYKKYDLHPDRILTTKEEGVYIVYDCIDNRGSRSLIIETYNDAEIGLVVCDNNEKKIVYNEDILDLNFENAVKIFKINTCK